MTYGFWWTRPHPCCIHFWEHPRSRKRQKVQSHGYLCLMWTEKEFLIKISESCNCVQMAHSSPVAQGCVVLSLKKHWQSFQMMLALSYPLPSATHCSDVRCKFWCCCFNILPFLNSPMTVVESTTWPFCEKAKVLVIAFSSPSPPNRLTKMLSSSFMCSRLFQGGTSNY